jgi:hypothetical protein
LKGRAYHHDLAYAFGGPEEEWNLILLRIERHDLWHKIFKLRSVKEIIAVLERLQRMKDHQRFQIHDSKVA